jgi:hypothetical protein
MFVKDFVIRKLLYIYTFQLGCTGSAVIVSGFDGVRTVFVRSSSCICTLSGALTSAMSLAPDFSRLCTGPLSCWTSVPWEDMTDCARDRSALADDPKVNQWTTMQSQKTIHRQLDHVNSRTEELTINHTNGEADHA